MKAITETTEISVTGTAVDLKATEKVERKTKAVENRVLRVDVVIIKSLSRIVPETKEKIESRKTELRKNRQMFPGTVMI